MAVVPIDFTNPFRYTDQQVRTRVYLRNNWNNAWVLNDNIDARSLKIGVGEFIDTCQLTYSYGTIQRSLPTPIASLYNPRLNLDRYFVKVVYTPTSGFAPATWFGIIVGTEDKRLGQSTGGAALDDAGNAIQDDAAADIVGDETEGGDQTFFAYGLEWLLTRVFLNKSVYEDSAGNDVTVKRSLPFNSGSKDALSLSDLQIIGNKAPGLYRFIRPDMFSLAEVWTTYDILEYLFNVYSQEISTSVGFTLAANLQSVVDWSVKQNLDLGPTLFDALNQLMSPRRGLTWSLTWNTVSDAPNMVITAHSFSSSDIDLGNGQTFPCNTAQISIPNEANLRNANSYVVKDTAKVFEQVKVYGARRGSCFTISYQDATLLRGWKTSEETLYVNAGAGGSSVRDTNSLKDAYRNSDAMSSVFARFIVPTTWNGKVKSLVSLTSPDNATCPLVAYDGTVSPTIQCPFWQPGLKFLRWIPLRQGYDYSTSATSPTNNNDIEIIPDYRSMFAVYKLGSGKYVMANGGATQSKDEKANEHLSFSADIQPLSDQLGLMISPAPLAHMHAKNSTFEINHPGGGFDSTTEFPREADYEQILATVFCEFDEMVTVVHPEVPRSGQNNQQAILEIHIGDIARLDYLVPGTVHDVKSDGTLLRVNATGGFVRDDRPTMQSIARIANIWYSQTRHGIQMSVAKLTYEISVGQLLVSVGPYMTNSVITQIEYDFDSSTTEFHTEFAELDPVGLII